MKYDEVENTVPEFNTAELGLTPPVNPTYCSEGVAHFDPSWKVDVIAETNILFIVGGNFDPLWRYSWCYHPNQHIVQRGRRIVIPHEEKIHAISPTNTLFIGGGEFWSLMKIKLMLLPQPTYYAEEVADFDPSWR